MSTALNVTNNNSNSFALAAPRSSEQTQGKHKLADSLLFSTRPPEVQEKIDQVFNKLVKNGVPNWGHNGRDGFYDLLNFTEKDIIAQRIEKTSQQNKTMYFVDLGAGQFGWVDAVRRFLRHEYADSSHQFHVIGVTGEGETYDEKNVEGNVTTHKISGFKLENLLESFEKLGLNLENSARYIVCSWTLQHLVDPLGTLEQAFHLLDHGGLLFGTGFITANPYSGQKFGFGNLLARAFGAHSYIARKGMDSADTFALLRDPDGFGFSYAKSKFAYNSFSPILEISGRSDSFTSCFATINPKDTPFEGNYEMGGKLYGYGTYVLEQLIGNEAKRVKFSNGHVENIPLFGYSEKALEQYLDTSWNYEVDLERNKGKGPESHIAIRRRIAELEINLGIKK